MELPLFPLNSVLFPTMPLKLHIFEERYKLMINHCVDNQEPFGVVLIASGDEALGPLATPYMVGTTAHIQHVQKLPYERMNIMAVGRDRFIVNELHNDRPYLYADVELQPFDENPEPLAQSGTRLRPLVERYLGALEEARQVQIKGDQIPRDPMSLAYLAAMILQTDMAQKQDLLEASHSEVFITNLVKLYQREVALLDFMLSPPADLENDQIPFSLN